MFYRPDAGDHGLPHDPFKAIVAPRPIGWISTIAADGRTNLAPYSYFNAVSARPHLVMFSSEGPKDTITFAEETGEFVCNLATHALRVAMNVTSAPAPRGVSEFELAGLTPAPSTLVRPPRVAESPVAMECVLVDVVRLKDRHGRPLDRLMAIGEVVGIHVDDRLIVNGRYDTAAARPIARLGYADYAVVDAVFSIERPPGG